MPKRETMVLGTLVAVPRTWRDPKTGEVREYYGYELEFSNSAVVRFAPLADDRKLLDFCMRESGLVD